ncbi:MAG TPA: succinate dehydrogenase assembly factor 2 [Rubrivivax sp.]|nr:succinate dehydrogenase assembly factor 2 [Rubrivivax sp.]
MDTPLDERSLSRLKWGCRRGLLENDLFIERFFQRYEQGLSVSRARGLQWLMDLSDNDLLDLLLRRSELPPALDRPEVSEVLELLRQPAPVHTNPTSKGIAP